MNTSRRSQRRKRNSRPLARFTGKTSSDTSGGWKRGVITIGRKGKSADWLTPDGLMLVEGFARDGLSDAQIAQKIGISYQTLYDWEKRFPEFLDAIKKGKAPVDIEVENALLKRALGYDYEEVITEVEELGEGRQKKHIRKIRKHMPGETAAQIFWLKNRRPGRWRDKVESAPEVANELLQSLMELERRSQA